MRSKGVRVAATSEGNKDIETIINRKNQFSIEIAIKDLVTKLNEL